jgi:chromatin remodeling complex protein RSC6
MNATYSKVKMTSVSENIQLDNLEPLQLQWKNMELSLTDFKCQVVLFQQQLRNLEKMTRQRIRQLEKDTNKIKIKNNRKPSGFAKPSPISKELCFFMGKSEGTEMARTEVTQFIITYIKQNNLAVSKDIHPDEKLSILLGITSSDTVNYFNIQKFMNKHFIKK